MFTKRSTLTIVAVCLSLAPATVLAAGSSGTVVTVNASVVEYISWDTATQTVTVPAINATNSPKSATGNFKLYTNTAQAVTIKPTSAVAGVDNSGILTEAGGKTLTTKYGIEGHVTNGNGAGLAPHLPAAFCEVGGLGGRTYTLDNGIPRVNGDYSIDLTVIAEAQNVAPPVGNYTCTVTLTASF